ncbi:MAG: hypothetical protein K6A14_04955 [Erysipelotrichaceae bacterium]|nr:hypothetical protein [Erysipelotrichaceae bacterium]
MESKETRTVYLKKLEVQRIMDDWCRRQVSDRAKRRYKNGHFELYSRIFTLEPDARCSYETGLMYVSVFCRNGDDHEGKIQKIFDRAMINGFWQFSDKMANRKNKSTLIRRAPKHYRKDRYFKLETDDVLSELYDYMHETYPKTGEIRDVRICHEGTSDDFSIEMTLLAGRWDEDGIIILDDEAVLPVEK